MDGGGIETHTAMLDRSSTDMSYETLTILKNHSDDVEIWGGKTRVLNMIHLVLQG